MTKDTSLTLVADIGGTNTRVALAEGAVVQTETIKRYRNAAFEAGLAAVLTQYIADLGGVAPTATCVAVAGPVHGDTAQLTNLHWTMDHQMLRAATGAATVDILNDLQAQGHAVGDVAPEMLDTVIDATIPSDGDTSLVIGVGTGFNAAQVFDTSDGRLVPPSESGHVTLPTRGALQDRLSAFLTKDHGFPSVEDVLSGRGIENVYRFWGAETGTNAPLTAQQIMKACADGDALARQTVETCVQMLGNVAGNLALTQLPYGGIFLVGGVSRALAPYFEEFGFQAAFRDKGRFSDFMDDFSVRVVTDDYAALTGCAAHMARTKAA